jgi:CubicO group peptidase (beta-lactamase class C family)
MNQLMNQTSVKPPQQKNRLWAKRGIKMSAGVLVIAVLLVIGYFAAEVIYLDPVTAYRIETSGGSNIDTYKIFPQRAIATGGSVSVLPQASLANFPTTISFGYQGRQYTSRLTDLLAQTDTQAFIVIRNNAVIYEQYLNGASRDTLFTSFSMAKSFTSALIGIAIDEGKIGSVNDPVIKYVPELKGRGFDGLTIRDMLLMSTGVAFQNDVGGLFNNFVSDDARQYFTDNLRQLILHVHASSQPIGAGFHYNDFYPLLEGLILQHVTGETVAQFTQDALWKPMGMEYPASWSLDSTTDGFEKTNSALNARAIDFARFGLLFLNQGRWNGRQIVSQQWVTASTTPDPADQRSWNGDPHQAWQQAGGYYKYHWWGLNNPGGTYDYLAWGKQDQLIYVSPSTNTVVVRLGGGEADSALWQFAIRALVRSIPS